MKKRDSNMTTGQLNSISFFNTERFPYGQIEVSGNTMVCGTNGVGKTTTVQATLFFYGVGTKDLGITTQGGSNHKKWLDYAYPYPNSYTVYQYDGIAGKNLLLTFQAGNQIGYRFAHIESMPDLKEIMFIPNTKLFAEQKDVIARFTEIGIHFSKPVKGSERYRSILYGNSKGDDRKAFGDYAMMKTAHGYDQIPNVLSSIFLNTSMKGSLLESAIAGAISAEGVIDLQGLRKDCAFIRDYRQSIRSFEETKAIRSRLFDEMVRHKEGSASLAYHIQQMIAMKDEAIRSLPALEMAAQNKTEAHSNALIRHEKIIAAAEQDEKERLKDKIAKNAKLDDAKELAEQYSDGTIHKKIDEVAQLDEYRVSLGAEKSLYRELTSGQQDIENAYNERINMAKSNATKQKGAINDEVLIEKERVSKKSKELRASEAAELEELKSAQLPEKEALKKTMFEARKIYNDLQVAFAALRGSNPFEQKLQELTKTLAGLKTEKEVLSREADATKKIFEQSVGAVERLKLEKEQVSESARKMAELACKPLLQQIKDQQKLLDTDGTSLLGFIRRQNHPSEGAITALLKDEVLNSSTLSPSLVNPAERSFYGIVVDENALAESNYDTEAIEARIEILHAEIEAEKQHYDAEAKIKLDVCGKKIIEEMGKQEDCERKSGDIRAKTVECENKINRIEEEIGSEQGAAAKKWEAEILKSSALLNEAKAADEEATNLNDTFYEDSEKKQDVIRKRFDAQVFALEQESDKLVSGMKQRSDEIDKALAKNLDDLQKEKASALETNGVDKQALAEITKRIEEIEGKVRQAEAWQSDVKVYERDKVLIDLIPEHEKALALAEKAHSDASFKKTELQKSCGIEAIRLKEEAAGASAKLAEAETIISEANDSLPKLEQRIDIAIEDAQLENDGLSFSQHFTEALASDGIIKASYSKIMSYVSQVATRVKIKDSELFPFLENVAQNENYLSAAEEMLSFTRNGGLEAARQMVAQNFFEVLKLIRDNYDKVMKGSDKARSVVNDTNRVLSEAIEGIPILDELKLSHKESEDALLKIMEKLKDVDIPVGDKNSLFWDESSGAKFEELYEIFVKLVDELFKTSRTKIEVTDTYEILFGVAENGRALTWARSRDKIGSTGTTVIAKTLIYISLLESILLKAKVQSNPMIHVLVDEIGTLSQANMQRILNFANGRGIALFNAAPEPKLPRLYNQTYLYQLVKGKALIKKVELKAIGVERSVELAEN